MAGHPEPGVFLHLDAEIHSSAVTVLDAPEDPLRPGAVALFDRPADTPGRGRVGPVPHTVARRHSLRPDPPGGAAHPPDEERHVF
jgi:hypothetical protein